MSDDTVRPFSETTADGALPADLNYVTDELKKRAQTELFEDEDTRVHSLKLLRCMLEKERNLKWQDDDLFLLAFLRARKFDVERAFSLIKGFYHNLGKHGDLYYNLNFGRLKTAFEENHCSILPYRDRDSSVIIVFRCGVWNPDTFSAVELLPCFFLSIIQALRSPSTQISGCQLITDFKGYSMKHVMHSTPRAIRIFSDLIQNALPIRMRGIHVVNHNNFFSYVWPVFKIFLSKKLSERIHVHGSNMKSLHKFFHPSILPADLEGEMPPYDNTEWRQKMDASTNYFTQVLSFGYENYLKKDWKKKSKENIDNN